MSNYFGDAFGRTFRMLTNKLTILFYPLVGGVVSGVAVLPVIVVVFWLYLKPVIELTDQVSEDQAARIFFEHLFSPGLVGSVITMLLIILFLAVQAYMTSALNGTFRDVIKGESVSVAIYFKNGLKYWPKAFAVMVVGAAVFGVPTILFVKFSIIRNLDIFINNPNIIGPSFLMGLAGFGLLMLVITIFYGLVSFFWLPGLIFGDLDIVGGLNESARLGFNNLLYIVAFAVIQLFISSIISVISNANQFSTILMLLVMVINYIVSIYFSFFKFVWYGGIIELPENIQFPATPQEYPANPPAL